MPEYYGGGTVRGGYQQAQDDALRKRAADMQQVAGATGILSKLAEQQRAAQQQQEMEQLKPILAQAGGDPSVAIKALLASGNPKAIELASKLHAFAPKPAEPFTLSEGQTRFGSDGKPISAGVPKIAPVPPIVQASEYLNKLPPDHPNRPIVEAWLKKQTENNPPALSNISKLISERNALPVGHPDRTILDRAITAAEHGSGTKVTVNTGNLALGKPAGNKIDEGLLDTTQGIMRLSAIEGQFKPEYQQLGGRIGAGWSALKDKAGIAIPDADKTFLTEFSAYKRNAINSMNEYIKSITGAAMSEQEAQRILRGMPNPGQGITDGDSPAEFKAKLDDAMKQTKVALARYTYIKQRGLKISNDAGEMTIPLEKMPQIMNERGKELESGFRQANQRITQAEVSAKVRAVLAKEFGLIQ